MQPLAMNKTLPAIISNQSNERALEMDNLKLLQFFHLYTAKNVVTPEEKYGLAAGHSRTQDQTSLSDASTPCIGRYSHGYSAD